MMEKPLASSRWPLIGTFSRRQYSLLRAARAECCRSHVVRKDIGCSDRRFDGAPAPLRIVPFHVRKESVGFIFNRIWAALKRESLEVVKEGVSTPTEVDHIFELVLGGTHGGPFRLMDNVGLDVALDIEEHYAAIHPELPSEPRELLKQYIKEGRLGLKTGKADYGQRAPAVE